MNTAVSTAWKLLSEEEKGVYAEQAQTLRAAYETEVDHHTCAHFMSVMERARVDKMTGFHAPVAPLGLVRFIESACAQ